MKADLNILIAPNALKGSLSAIEAANAIADGLNRAVPSASLQLQPIADGGDGLLDALEFSLKVRRIPVQVQGSLGSTVESSFLLCPEQGFAVIEMASAAGLALLPEAVLDPMRANTYGVGQLIQAALDEGVEHIVLGIGGSATHDVATGLAAALGAQFYDSDGKPVTPGGASLASITRIELGGLDKRLQQVRLDVMCDVQNPLLGEQGAANVYAPQKGANPEQVLALEKATQHFADILESETGITVRELPGAGAAGGMGAGLMAMLGARLRPGAELILELVQIDSLLEKADLVITTEGQLDSQSRFGKAPMVLAKHASNRDIPCFVIAGSVDQCKEVNQHGVTAYFSLCPGPVALDKAMQHAASYLADASEQVARSYFAGVKENKMKRRKEDVSIKKCLFPAAGYGTRFLPATKSMPKEILPIVDKPLIQYGVEEAMEAGMSEMAIITGRGKRSLEDHFDTNYELEHQISGTAKEELLADIRRVIDECTFSYTRQIEMKGLGHAILTGETLIGNEPFGVILADDLCEGDDGDGVLKQMVNIYEKYRCSVVAVEEVDPSEVHKYGVIEGRRLDDGIYMVSSMVEKPSKEEAPSNLAIIGRYILTPDIFDIIRKTPPGKNGEMQITDSLEIQAKDNMVIAYQFKGKRFDCGSIEGYVEATNYFYNKRKEEEGE